ncbi:TadE family protein [Microbacterium sp. C5A9]|uniref:TadE family protein n=1 Tax=Microbacterium sp. C5A9 TaxID=2736663 RepID=UPI001F51D6D5|nr:TadE family protein [Microbacterium sp. C5A9]MCI1019371.1 TadE family protein [Microbacterium sp. C5A9]
MDDEGSAALEFIAVGVILLVPLVYLIIVLGSIQEQTLGVEAAARHTARVVALAPDAETAAARSDRVLASVVEEYGIDEGTLEVSMECPREGGECPRAGSTIVLTITARVSLPLVPAVFGLQDATSITVQGSAVQKVSRTWGMG